jgi:hypothetical protein
MQAADRRLPRTGTVEDFAYLDAVPVSWRRAASMSVTTRSRALAEPGAADVSPVPKWIEDREP